MSRIVLPPPEEEADEGLYQACLRRQEASHPHVPGAAGGDTEIRRAQRGQPDRRCDEAARLRHFFPEQKTKADLPDRVYFFNILNTTDPGNVNALLQHAQGLRFGGKAKDAEKNRIEVTEELIKELQASPFYSSMTIA